MPHLELTKKNLMGEQYGVLIVSILEDVDCIMMAPKHKADSRFAPTQWETLIQSKSVSHWQGANLESALKAYYQPFLSRPLSLVLNMPTYIIW